VSYQGLRLVPASYSDNHNGSHDWKSKDLFIFSAKVPGTLVMPINPDVASHNFCDTFFLFQSSELIVRLNEPLLRGGKSRDMNQVTCGKG